MEQRLKIIEEILETLIEETNRLATTSSATYALNKCLLSSLVIALQVSGTNLNLVSKIFFDAATDKADSLNGEQRRIFLEETKMWLEMLNLGD